MTETRAVEFPGVGGETLTGRLEMPPGEPKAFAIFAHCFSCSKDFKAVVQISRSLADSGLAVLRFDFTGVGGSGGEFPDTNFTTNLDDLKAAVDFLREHYQGPQLLIGHSLGGTAALAVGREIPELKAVATIAAASGTAHLKDLLLARAPELAGEGYEAEIELAGRPVRIRRQLLEDLDNQSVAEKVGSLGKPLLIFHSPDDRVVPIEHAARIYDAATHPKSFVAIDGADHLLLDDRRDAQFVARVLWSWASRFLQPREASLAPEAGEGQVLVAAGPTGLAQQIAASGHMLRSDEPEDQGGGATGPTPYDLLLASLGACTSMTLRMYAERKEWPLERIGVHLEHTRVHARDCSDCESSEGKIDWIDRKLFLEGPLTEEQRQRLVEIANRCPVHRTLTTETRIETRLKSPSD